MCSIYKNRSLAPSQRGKRPLLLDILNTTDLIQSEDSTQKPKRRTLKNVKDVQIQERKALLLSDNGVRAAQEVISEHVSSFINISLCSIHTYTQSSAVEITNDID